MQLSASATFVLFTFPLLWMVLPFKVPQNYIGLRHIDKDNHDIISDTYCLKDCKYVKTLRNKGFNKERMFYSWRYAELLNRSNAGDPCCFNTPFDIKQLFGFMLIIELTFEYFTSNTGTNFVKLL